MKQSNSSQRSKTTDNSADKYFSELKKENYDNTFSSVDIWLRNLSPNFNNQTPERKINIMKNYLALNRFKLVYLSIFIIFIIGFTTMPVTSHESVGDIITWKIESGNELAKSELNKLEWLSESRIATINLRHISSTNDEYKVVLPKEEHNNLESHLRTLESIDGISDVKAVSINETVKRSLFSKVLNDIFKINIDATNKSDQEVETEIRKQLREAGIESVTVQFEKNPKGERLIKLNIPNDEMKNDGGVDVTIKDGENVSRYKEVRKSGPGSDDEKSFKNMTDSEIRSKVRQDLSEPNLTDNQIQIERNGGSIKIKILKEDGSEKGKLEIEEDMK